MPTFGQGAVGSLDNECFANFKQGGRFLLTDTGAAQFQVTKITARLAGTGSGTGDQLLRAAVYADDGSGGPGVLLGSSDEVLIVDGAAAAWVDFNFSTPAVINGGTGVPYHLAIHNGAAGQTARFFYSFASGLGWHNADTYSDGPSNPAGSKVVDDADYSITATYSTYTPPTPSIAISTPTPAQSISGAFLCSAAVTAVPHHTQFEISADGITWWRLCAKNRLSPYEHTFNTWRFPNGTYQIRARYYTGSRPNTLLLTSAPVTFTINNPAGTTRDYSASLGDTISAALTAAADGDTIRLTGDFSAEGSPITSSKRVKIIKHPSASSNPIIRTRLRLTGNAYCEDVVFYQSNLGNFLLANEQTACFKRCEFSSLGTASNAGTTVGGLNAFDPDGAIDPVFDECIFHDTGNWLDPGFSTGGIHGVYNQHSRRSYYVNCIAYSNTGFCWKLYPNAQETTVYKCLAYRSLASYYFGGDVGQATAATLGAQLLNTDTAATISGGVPADWPSSGTVKIAGNIYLTYTGKSGTQITGLSLHSTIPNGSTIDIYTASNYNTVERCIGGWTGNDGAGNRYSEDGIVQSRWIGGGSPPKGVGNEVLESLLHDPATSGPGTEAVLGANAYIDNRTDSLRGNITDAGGNITGIAPGYANPVANNFQLDAGDPGVGYGPDSIQPPFTFGNPALVPALKEALAELGDLKQTAKDYGALTGEQEVELGWLLCNGAVVTQAKYQRLYARIGSLYNTGGEGAGNFRLPDGRDCFLLPSGNLALRPPGARGGALGHQHLAPHAHTQSHTHTMSHSHSLQGHSHVGVLAADNAVAGIAEWINPQPQVQTIQAHTHQFGTFGPSPGTTGDSSAPNSDDASVTTTTTDNAISDGQDSPHAVAGGVLIRY